MVLVRDGVLTGGSFSNVPILGLIARRLPSPLTQAGRVRELALEVTCANCLHSGEVRAVTAWELPPADEKRQGCGLP